MTKIIDLLHARSPAEPFISYEFFPPKTEKGLLSLDMKLKNLTRLHVPLFVDYTWGAGGSTAELTLELALAAKARGYEPNMHLTCTNMDLSLINDTLAKCHAAGIRNLLALRGDPPVGQHDWTATKGGFACALDLVRHIRAEYGDFFSISVAGYPEGHPAKIKPLVPLEPEPAMDNANYSATVLSASERQRVVVLDDRDYVCSDADFAHELAYLKAKVDAGADFIVTQMFFDAECFLAFVRAARACGITCPIIPGVMCLQNLDGFQRMIRFCKSRVPKKVLRELEALRDAGDPGLVKAYGVQMGIDLCRRVLDAKDVEILGLHFYTLNQDYVVTEIVQALHEAQVVPKACEKTTMRA